MTISFVIDYQFFFRQLNYIKIQKIDLNEVKQP